MVIFRSPEGKPGYHQAEGLDAAMRFAEMLRNQEQVTDARIFRMDEVPIEFKTYYRVEMAAAAGSGTSAAAEVPAAEAPADPSAPEPPTTEAPDASAATPVEATAAASASENAEDALAGDGEPEPGDAGAKGAGRHGIFSRS
jgi:hypothetical protein